MSLRSLALLACWLVTAQAYALGTGWSVAPTVAVDGYAAGDVDGDGRLEIALIGRGGTYDASGFEVGVGSLVLLDASGSQRWALQTGAELIGYPAMGDFDGDGLAEIAFCENGSAGYCYVIDGDGSQLHKLGPYAYAAMTSAGPSVADLNSDGVDDFVITTFQGPVIAFDGATGAELWSANLYTRFGDEPFGHAAIGDLDNDGLLDVVVGGFTLGGVYALNGQNGQTKWSRTSLGACGGTFNGSGPTLADVNDDGKRDVIVTLSYAASCVAAVRNDGQALLWSTSPSGADFYYQSPIATDLDGDTIPEVIAQSGDGMLYVLAPSGSIKASTSVGAASWVPPSLVDFDSDGTVDVIGASTTGVSIFSVSGSTLSLRDSYDATGDGGGLTPMVMVGDFNQSGTIDLVFGVWWAERLLDLTISTHANVRWDTLGGSATRDGLLASTTTALQNAIDYVFVARDAIASVIADPATPAKVRSLLQGSTQGHLSDASKELLKASQKNTASQLKDTMSDLNTITGYDATSLKRTVAQAALQVLSDQIARAELIMGPTNAAIVAAKSQLANAQASFNAGNYTSVTTTVSSATGTLEGKVTYVGNFCTTTQTEPYRLNLCELQGARDQVLALLTTYPTNTSLKDTRDRLAQAMRDLANLDIAKAAEDTNRAMMSLLNFNLVSTTSLRSQIALTDSLVVRAFIDDVNASGLDPSGVTSANTSWSNGETARANGSYGTATSNYWTAASAAQP